MRIARWLACVLALGWGCDRAPASEIATLDAAAVEAHEVPNDEPVEVLEPLPPEPVAPPVPGPTVFIDAQTLRVGSVPGTYGRDARGEADQIPVEVAGFTIDRFLYPGEGEPPQTNVDRAQAAALCEGEGKRLCTEFEWELACSGSDDDVYAGGDRYAGTPSAFGVEGMGSIGEWTSSPAVRLAEGTDDAVVFRGAAPDDETPDETVVLRRCAARRGTSAQTHSRHIGFRCCQSAEEPMASSYPEERTRARFRSRAISDEDIRSTLQGIPQLASRAGDFALHGLEAAERAVGDMALLRGWELVDRALIWSPVPGEEIWVMSGRSGEDGLLVALYALPNGEFIHAASAILAGEPGPIAIAFTPPEREQVQWSARWGVSAEGGVLQYRNGRVTIETR